MLADISSWLDIQAITLHEPPPAPTESEFGELDKPPQTNTHALTTAIEKLILATASLHRAGPWYTSKSEPLWHFVAGSLSRGEYDTRVTKAVAKLPKRVSVEKDVSFAEQMVLEALEALKKEGDGRDVRDLMECLREFKKGGV